MFRLFPKGPLLFRLFPQGPLLFICFLRVRFCLYVSSGSALVQVSIDLIAFPNGAVSKWSRRVRRFSGSSPGWRNLSFFFLLLRVTKNKMAPSKQNGSLGLRLRETTWRLSLIEKAGRVTKNNMAA